MNNGEIEIRENDGQFYVVWYMGDSFVNLARVYSNSVALSLMTDESMIESLKRGFITRAMDEFNF